MKTYDGSRLSRRGLATLLAAAPASTAVVRQQGATEVKTPAVEAREALEGHRTRLKAVKLPREVGPAFRFEP